MTKRALVLAGCALAGALAVSPIAQGEESGDEDAGTPACARETFRILVDVGHTPESPGALSARGIDEYDFNLRLAKTIEGNLVNAGFVKTGLLMVNGPAKGSMYKRVARANKSSADLLLSIHHDSVPNSFKKTWEFEGQKISYSDRFSGHSIFISHGNAERKDSLLFAGKLGAQLKARGLEYTDHYTEPFMGRYRRTLLDATTGVYRYDTLYLLKKTRMPAALLEAGSIVNRDDELLVQTDAYRITIASAVVDAVDAFCAEQTKK